MVILTVFFLPTWSKSLGSHCSVWEDIKHKWKTSTISISVWLRNWIFHFILLPSFILHLITGLHLVQGKLGDVFVVECHVPIYTMVVLITVRNKIDLWRPFVSEAVRLQFQDLMTDIQSLCLFIWLWLVALLHITEGFSSWSL